MFTLPGVHHRRAQVEVFLEPGGIERHAASRSDAGRAGRWLERWCILAAFAALGLATWWLTRPRYAWVILVDGKPVAAVASREQANEVLDSLKRQAAGPLARAAHFREKVTLERVSAADQPVLSRWRAQELVGKRVQVGIPAYQLSVNDKPVLSLRSLAEVRRALEKVVKHQVPSGWRPLGTPRIVERLTVEEAWLAPEQARRQLVSVSRAAERLLSPAVPAREYVVKKGDVAARLARRHGITLADLQSANPGMDLNRLREGDRLVIAGSRPLVSVTVQAQTDTTAPVNFWTETVRSASVPPGQRRVIQRGRPGQQRVRVAATFVNGREISRRTLWGEMASEPVPERVMVGPGARSAERSRRHPRTVRGE